jgi:hypothetical protein
MSSINLSPSLQMRKQVAGIATIALVGIAYFGVIIVALHFLRPDHNPVSQPTSAYAVGPYGFLMTSAFFSMSVASLALVIGLHRAVSPPARSRMGLGLLGLWGVGVLIAGIFPIDLEGTPQTISGTIHRINGPLTFLSLTAGAILVSRRFKQDEKWRPFYRSALILSWVMLAEFVAVGLTIATASGFPGLGQRIFIATFVTWLLLTAARLRSVALGSVSA